MDRRLRLPGGKDFQVRFHVKHAVATPDEIRKKALILLLDVGVRLRADQANELGLLLHELADRREADPESC